MPDPFSTLPAPLPLMIFKTMEDLSTLNYMLRASPAANVIFRKHYCEVTEAVLSNFVPELQLQLRTIALIRSDRLSIRNTLDSPEALDNFLLACVQDRKASTKPLSNSMISLSAVRSVVGSASQVQQVSALFFQQFLGRVNSIKPSCLLDQSYSYYSSYPKELPEGRPYEPIKCDHPSWIEEQRVCRALWRLELYFDLVTITKSDLGNTNQVGDLLKNKGPHRVWLGLMTWETDEMDCVYEFLHDVSEATTASSAQPPHLSKLPLLEHKSVTAQKSIPHHDVLVYNWCQSTIHLSKKSPAANFFYTFGSVFFSPLYNSSFTPFRRLGFGIWDLEKMVRLGLIPLGVSKQPPRVSEMYWVGPFERSPRQDDFLFRWKSLLADDCKSNGRQ